MATRHPRRGQPPRIWLSSSDSSGQAADWPAPLEKGRLMPIHQITGLYLVSPLRGFIAGLQFFYVAGFAFLSSKRCGSFLFVGEGRPVFLGYSMLKAFLLLPSRKLFVF